MNRKTEIYAWVEGYIQALEYHNLPVTYVEIAKMLNIRYNTPIYRNDMQEIVIEMLDWKWNEKINNHENLQRQ